MEVRINRGFCEARGPVGRVRYGPAQALSYGIVFERSPKRSANCQFSKSMSAAFRSGVIDGGRGSTAPQVVVDGAFERVQVGTGVFEVGRLKPARHSPVLKQEPRGAAQSEGGHVMQRGHDERVLGHLGQAVLGVEGGDRIEPIERFIQQHDTWLSKEGEE